MFTTIQFGSYLPRVAKAIVEMDAALAAGTVFKANFDRIKSPLEYGVEQAWKGSVIEAILSNRADWNDAITELYYSGHPTAHTIKTVTKRVETLAKTGKFDAVAKLASAFLAEIAPIYVRLNTLKGLITKRETKAETVAREAAYKPAPVESNVLIAIRARLTEIAEGARAQLEANFADYDRRMLAVYFAADLAYTANTPSKPTFYKTPHAVFVGSKARSQRNHEAAQTVDGLLQRRDRAEMPMVRVDAEEVIVTNAKRAANEVVDHFINKNLKKLVSIIEAKGGYESAELLGNR
ncbi:MAG: hypothetical protein EON55_12940, partial [Alphaproteobacteria bacterium]